LGTGADEAGDAGSFDGGVEVDAEVDVEAGASG